MNRVKERYEMAKEKYAKLGVDTDLALQTLDSVRISINCWQGDDVRGFEECGGASGGTAVTGSYPGRARTPEELMSDLDKALSLIPGKHKVDLQAFYAITDGEKVERCDLQPRHFDRWVAFAKEHGIGLNLNPSFFSHPMVKANLSLSHPDKAVRDYWIKHGQSCNKIAEAIGRELGILCVTNFWMPDGYKDVPADRLGPRKRMKEALDEIFKIPVDGRFVMDTLESKVFGIGVESFTVGSHEFCMNYAARNDAVSCLFDIGHYHPTEKISDKIPSMLLFGEKIALHVTRGVRWDSDHVVLLEDELLDIAKEIVRCGGLNDVMIGLDFFDASINRVAAWVIGTRNMQKALLMALLMPHEKLSALQAEERFTELMVMNEELKFYPFADVWDMFCVQKNVPLGEEWLKDIQEYERRVLVNRV